MARFLSIKPELAVQNNPFRQERAQFREAIGHPRKSTPFTGLAMVGVMPTGPGGESKPPRPGGRNPERPPSQKEDRLNLPAMAPWIAKFLEDELALFDGLSGVSRSLSTKSCLRTTGPSNSAITRRTENNQRAGRRVAQRGMHGAVEEPEQFSNRVGWEEDGGDPDVSGLPPAKRTINT